MTDARAAIRQHANICRTCGTFSAGRAQWCDDGWDLQEALLQARCVLRGVKAMEQLQGQLW